jgi:hypothetical protein
MCDDETDTAKRAKQRHDWPLRAYPLGGEPGEDLSATTTARDRIAMMWPLAVEAWCLTGRPMPEYTRDTMPVRVLRDPE